MIFYDFEVFFADWLMVGIDPIKQREHIIINDRDKLQALYDAYVNDIWVGFYNNHYDKYIVKGILTGFNPKEINDFIIVDHQEGWQFSSLLNKIPMNNYDCMPNPPIGLKTLEGFLGSDIRESNVDFNIRRKLTQAEIEETVHYCRHDVEETIKVFLHTQAQFEAMFSIVQEYKLPLHHIGDSEARITATVLQCKKRQWDDEFSYFFLPCLKLKKYKFVQDWFANAVNDCTYETGYEPMTYEWCRAFYKRSLEVKVAGVPHVFGFGGLHGAQKQIHRKGLLLHVDVGSYYPSMLIAWDLVTRSAQNPGRYAEIYQDRMNLKAKQLKAKDKEEKKHYKAAQLPKKKMLNALSGAMKDKANPAYDPRNNNTMCINGQLMLLDLIEHLEVVPGFELIQSNTDGLIILIPDTDEAFYMVDDICYEWEQRCSTDKCKILLELDTIAEIYQKDVNNYLWIEPGGEVERKGAYVKSLSPLDYDLPILNRALVDYMTKGTPVEETINSCNDLIEFQKIVKLSDKYTYVVHECGGRTERKTGVRVKKTIVEYTQSKMYLFKSYRVFASNDPDDGRILKGGGKRGKLEKFGGTPDHCFIFNDTVENVTCPENLDRGWYIQQAKERLKGFGVVVR